MAHIAFWLRPAQGPGNGEKDREMAIGEKKTKAGDSSSSTLHSTADYGQGVASFPF